MAATDPIVSGNIAWSTRGGVIAMLLIATIALYYPTYAEIFGLWWNNSSYNHCLLIVPISCYLIWLKREALLANPPTISWYAVAFIGVNCLVWVTGNLMSINVLQHVAAIGFLIGGVWVSIGWGAFRLLLFPLLYLYFGVPEGEILVPYLQDLTADVVVRLLRFSSIPVYLEGRYLTIPSGQFHVAKACSGINYLIATLAVGTMFAYLRYRSIWRRIAFMFLVILVPLAANGARAYGIVMIAHLSDYKYAMGVDHFIYGWLFFGVVIFILFAIGDRFTDVDSIDAAREAIAVDTSTRASPVLGIVIVSLLLLATATRLPNVVADRGNTSTELQLQVGSTWPYVGEETGLGGEFTGAHQYLTGRYAPNADSLETVQLEVYFFRNQRQGAEIINIRNTIFDEDSWRRVAGPDKVSISNEKIDAAFQVVIKNHLGERLIWYWYDISGHATSNKITAKIQSIRSALFEHYLGEAVIVVSTPIGRSIEEAEEKLSEFVSAMNPGITNMMTRREK